MSKIGEPEDTELVAKRCLFSVLFNFRKGEYKWELYEVKWKSGIS